VAKKIQIRGREKMINEFWRAKRVPPALVVTAGASVVTGGNGFLGKHRVRKLSERDAEVFLAGGGTLQRERAGEPFDSTQGRLLPRASAASRSASGTNVGTNLEHASRAEFYGMESSCACGWTETRRVRQEQAKRIQKTARRGRTHFLD
jgi:hypothetical protein